MTDAPQDETDRTPLRPRDPDVQRGPIGTGPGYSGEEYDGDEQRFERALKAGKRQAQAESVNGDADLPPDNGKRASLSADGAVHGSGVGAGGGSPGEDYSSDSAAGDGPPQTGKGSR